ncbi:hypothetical protein MLF92_17410 [Escherichia coli]|nr:hypothetical protein [Escherichia coli]MCN2838712.1 hypothetical protein [Escherichia coli]MCN4693580.1 hypothetical protein [Escherichia coli]MCN7826978.1 hypothetical protein [Escherichia coli]
MTAAEKIKQRKRDNSLRDLRRTPDWLFAAIQRYLGQVEVNINPGGSMLVVFRGFCQDAGHSISKIPLDVMKSLEEYDPANVIRKKRPSKKAA